MERIEKVSEMGKKSIDRLEREEKDLYDIIGKIKGIHGHYLTERT